MKKLLLAVATVMAITGCSQNEEFENVEQNAEINISTVVKTTPRATVIDNDNFTEFKVTSFILKDAFDWSTENPGSAYMSDVKYTGCQTSGWTAESANKYYWPAGDKKIQFFGYPSDATLVTTDTGYPSIKFAISDVVGEQKDLVVATENMSKPDGDNLANLKFGHILTKINFSYKPADGNYAYTISNIKITGVKGGNATYTYANTVEAGSWSGGTDVASGYMYVPEIASSAEANGYYKLDNNDGSLMLLPQTFTESSAKIEITYKTEKNGVTFFDGKKV